MSSSTPARFCDVVMKGGITSGVVYPLALVEIAGAFRLKNIGGTSAGAIAAAAAAAAELGRTRGGPGFARLKELPNELCEISPQTGRSRLFGFFQPQRATKSLFTLGVAALGGGWRSWLLRVPLAAARAFPFWFFGGAAPGIWLGWIAWHDAAGGVRALGLAAALLVAIAGAAVATILRVLLLAKRRLPAHHFGLCSGMPAAGGKHPQEPLTIWLTRYLDEIAGRPAGENDPPLTFGDLWQLQPGSDERAINLEMMTTCLTHGRPYRLPFREDKIVNDNANFFFRADEFRQFFPPRVVAWMLAHARSADDKNEKDRQRRERLEAAGFHRLPAPADLPVVVATRMSLSFPVLLCAVPLHAIDFTRVVPEDQRMPERCWFSDGGICSNFPVHFFDSPLPRWPTFGIDLVEPHPDRPTPVWMPRHNNEGLRERWKRFDARGGFGAVFGFLGAILNTAKDWTDNTQARLPGFRDRIAAISLSNEEGGLNLDMPPALIAKLSGYGTEAGREFVRRFASDPAPADVDLNWQNHRRIRLRSGLAAIEEMILRLENSLAHPVAPDLQRPYETTVLDDKESYRWENNAQRDQAQVVLETLHTLGRQLAAAAAAGDPLPSDGAPKPYPELRARARV
ncbi:MAG TPA: hypothetical protein VHD62_06390 [Opitutaceae bacterium]|nr:hypothetical protein [Opitutaceae bacterium]